MRAPNINKKRSPTVLCGLSLLLIPMLPFSLELLLWGIIDACIYPELMDFIFAGLILGTSSLVSIILLRHPWPAARLSLSIVSFFVVLFELDCIKDSFFSFRNIFKVLGSWLILIIISAGISLLIYHLISFFTNKKPYRVAVLCIFLAISILINFKIYHPNGKPAKLDQKPNIILVVMDTTRADHLSIYGYNRLTTPGLGWLSQRAAIYENAMSPAPWTPPSHASLFTGLMPSEHGTDGDYNVFEPPGLVLSEVLKRYEYHTAAIVNNPMLAPEFGWNRGFDSYKTTWKKPKLSFSRIYWEIRSHHEDWPWLGSTQRTVYSARRWWVLNNIHRKFLFMNLIDPHSPYGEAHKFKDIYLDEETRMAPDLSNDSEDYDAGIIKAEGAALDRVIARYDGDIRFMDSCLETFFKWLNKRNELDDTLIILTSDHGERLGERGLLGHQLGIDQVLLHVPLLIRYPESIPPGRYRKQVQTHGIFSTILERAGIRTEKSNLKRIAPIEKQNLLVTVSQMRYQGNYLNSLMERNPEFDPTPYKGNWHAAFNGTWKLLLSSLGDLYLFNISIDSTESHNLINDYPEQVRLLFPYINALSKYREGKKAPTIPEKLRELLKSLGYIHD